MAVRAATIVAAGRKWFGPFVFRTTATKRNAARTIIRHDNRNNLTGMFEPMMLVPWFEPESRGRRKERRARGGDATRSGS